MDDKAGSASGVTNVFKHGRPPTKEEYTRVWIHIITSSEGMKCDDRPPEPDGQGE